MNRGPRNESWLIVHDTLAASEALWQRLRVLVILTDSKCRGGGLQ